MIDKQLLLDLLNIWSAPKKEDETGKFIMEWLERHNIVFGLDSHGNIFSLNHKGRPMLSAHMDTVAYSKTKFNSSPLAFEKVTFKGETEELEILRAEAPRIIGADDKVGIYIILKILEETPDLNFLFSTGEEVGATGSRAFVGENDLSDVLYALVLDRKGNSDIICANNYYGTKEFEEALCIAGVESGWEPATGVFSDCASLNKKVSCANLSVGYYNAHTENEFIVLSEVERCQDFVKKILVEVKTRFDPPVSKLHDVWFDNTFDDIFMSEVCCVSGTTKDLYYFPSLKSYFSGDVLEKFLASIAKKEYLKVQKGEAL